MDREKLLKIKEKNNQLTDKALAELDEWEKYAQEFDRISKAATRAGEMVDDISKQFALETKLNGQDITFLFIAVALQCTRQYVIGRLTERKSHRESEKKAHDIQKKISEKTERIVNNDLNFGFLYNAPLSEILGSFSVPFDVTMGTKIHNVGGDGKGLSGKDHRFKTLGHDPLFGWVFGSANIMTNTVTNFSGESFHVRMPRVVGEANTAEVLTHFIDRSKEKNLDLAACVAKEGLHLASDMYSYEGIPLPGVEKWFSPETARQLAEYGIDCGNCIKIGVQAEMAVMINQLIAMIHRMSCGDPEKNDKLFEVRTRKVLLYSNCIASTSNVIGVAIGSLAGVLSNNLDLTKKSLQYLDLGGLFVTIYRIVKDQKMIKEIKQEFLVNKYYEMAMDEIYSERSTNNG